MPTKSKAPKHADITAKEPNFRHLAYADYLREHSGYEDVDSKTVQLALSLIKPFRASKEYGEAIKAEKAKGAAKRAEAAERVIERKRAAADKLRERLAALEADIPKKAPAKKASAPAKAAAPKPTDEVSAKRAAKKASPRKAAAPKPAPVEQSAVLDDDDIF